MHVCLTVVTGTGNLHFACATCKTCCAVLHDFIHCTHKYHSVLKGFKRVHECLHAYNGLF